MAAEAAKHAATARISLTCLKGMLDVAVREDALSVNPAKSVSPIPATVSDDVRALDVAELVNLRAALVADATARRQDLADLVDVMLATGCRIGEALALRWDEVNLDRHVVYPTGTVVRERGVRLFRQDTTKGKKPRGYLVPAFAVMDHTAHVPQECRHGHRAWRRHRSGGGSARALAHSDHREALRHDAGAWAGPPGRYWSSSGGDSAPIPRVGGLVANAGPGIDGSWAPRDRSPCVSLDSCLTGGPGS